MSTKDNNSNVKTVKIGNTRQIDLTPHQPLYAYIELTINGKKISNFNLNPIINKDKAYTDCVMSLHVRRKVGGSGRKRNMNGTTFTLDLYDDTALWVEGLLQNAVMGKRTKVKGKDGKERIKVEKPNNVRNCHIVYGWSNYKGQKISSIGFEGRINNFTTGFEGASTVLNIEGASVADAQTNRSMTETFDGKTYQGKPSEIVKRLCQEFNLKIARIEETKTVYESDGVTPKTFRMENKTLADFVLNDLCPVSVSASSGMSGFIFTTSEKGVTFELHNTDSSDTVQTTNKSESISTNDKYKFKYTENPADLFPVLHASYTSYNHNNRLGSGGSNSGEDNNSISIANDSEYDKSTIFFVGNKFHIENLKKSMTGNLYGLSERISYVYDNNEDINSADTSISSIGIDWLKTKGIPSFYNTLRPHSRIYIMLGYRDISNVNTYLDYLKELSNSIYTDKLSTIYFVSLLPVNPKLCQFINNTQINQFNHAIQNGISYIDSDYLIYADIYTDIMTSIYRGIGTNNNTYTKLDHILKDNGYEYNTQEYQNIFNSLIHYIPKVDTISTIRSALKSVGDNKLANIKLNNVDADVDITKKGDIEKELVNMQIKKGISNSLVSTPKEYLADTLHSLAHIKDDMSNSVSTDKDKDLSNTPIKDITSVSNISNLASNITTVIGYNNTNIANKPYYDMSIYTRGLLDSDKNNINNKSTNEIKDKLTNSIISIGNIDTNININKLPISKDSRYTDLIVDAVRILTGENYKDVLNTTEITNDLLKAFDIDTGKADKYISAFNLVKGVLDKKDKANATDYTNLALGLGNLLVPKAMGTVNRIKDYADRATKVLNVFSSKSLKTNADISDITTEILTNIVPSMSEENLKYVKLGSDIYSAIKFGKADNIDTLYKDIGGLLNIDLDKLNTNPSIPMILNFTNTGSSIGNLILNPVILGTGIIGYDASKVSSTILNTMSYVDDWAGDTLNGLKEGIKNTYDSALESVKTGVKQAIAKAKSAWDSFTKGVPSKTIKAPAKDTKPITGYYEYYSGRRSNNVLSFSVTIKSSEGGSASNTLSIDRARNEMMECTVGNDLNDTTNTSDKDKDNTLNRNMVFGLSSSSYEVLENTSISLWNMFRQAHYTANLEILGDTAVQINSYIKLAVYTKYGFLHHSSGKYWVKSIEDTVSDGNFTTSLELVKNGPVTQSKRVGTGAYGGSSGGGSKGADSNKGHFELSGDNPNAEVVDSGLKSATNIYYGERMPNGENGCVEAATRLGSNYSQFLNNELENNVVGVDQLVSDANDSGIAVIPFSADDLEEGDVIVYGNDSDSQCHVVISDGNGGYVGNSSSQQKIVHGTNMYEMSPLYPTKIIKTARG